MENYFWKDLWAFITNRLVIMALVVTLLFYILIAQLFDLQIVNGQSYLNNLKTNILRELTIPAPRGTIVDKFGRPLAVNQSAFNVKIDPSTQVENWNQMLYSLIRILEKNEEEYIDELPISLDEPYTFLFANKEREEIWKRNMGIKKELYDMNADETFHYLLSDDFFGIAKEFPGLTNSEYRKILSLRCTLYLRRYSRYTPLTVAFGVSQKTVTMLEEDNASFPGVYVDTESLRYYPQGIYFSHILGYIGNISEEEYLGGLKDRGYGNSDTIGKTGLEVSYEDRLRGENGSMMVEVNSAGRRVNVIDDKTVQPTQGDKIFLTIDQDFQKKVYEILEEELKTILKNKMTVRSNRQEPITVKQVLISLMTSNNISAKKIFEAEDPDSASFQVKQYVLEMKPDAVISSREDINEVNQIVADGITSGKISQVQMLLLMWEQNIITGDEEFAARVKRGAVSPLTVILNKIDENELTPQMINLDPSSGSVVAVDVSNGDILAAIGYPSYDNNRLVNNMDAEYYNRLNNDQTTPIVHRPFMEPKAPGSTFKMITAIAGLEEGVISPTTTILDEVVFTKAGAPYMSSWASYSFGRINVVKALEVSSNYFFGETAYRLGNSKSGNTLEGIKNFNRYMEDFGLNQRTGVEIGELRDASVYRNLPSVISSPEFKKHTEGLDWYDGDTVRSAIGQAKSNYTAASMAKYITTLATRGKRYQLHLVNKVETQQGHLVEESLPNVETELQYADSTWNAVYSGMLAVTEGSAGTARNIFSGFPIRVAGKTGTAQEKNNRNDHSSFGGFAPFEDPQIAVYVVIPFGDTVTESAAATRVARAVFAEYLGLNSLPEQPAEDNALIP